MRAFARQWPVLAHFLLSFAIASLVVAYSIVMATLDPSTAGEMGTMIQNIYAGPWYANIITIFIEALKAPSMFGVFIFAGAPTIAALVLAAGGAGGGLRRLLRRLKPVGPDGSNSSAVRLYVGLLIVYALGFLCFDFVAGPGVDAGERLRGAGVGLLGGALLALFLDEGGTLEELGWRGFAYHSLLGGMRSPLGAAILLGAVHWVWHSPREVPLLISGTAGGSWLAGQAVFLFLCLQLSIVACFCVNRTGGSVWPAIFVHGGTNAWAKGMGDHVGVSFQFIDLRTLLVTIIAAAIVIYAGRDLGLTGHGGFSRRHRRRMAAKERMAAAG